MNYYYGNECAKAVEEYRGLPVIQEYSMLSKDFEYKRLWAKKYQDLYKKNCHNHDRIETDLTSTREHMENTLEFLIAYELNKFDDDSSEDKFLDAVLV